jgi:hypothetical protein
VANVLLQLKYWFLPSEGVSMEFLENIYFENGKTFCTIIPQQNTNQLILQLDANVSNCKKLGASLHSSASN